MTIETFVEKFREQLIDAPIVEPGTKFREIASWDSLTAMAVIAMVEDELKVTISDSEMRGLNTVQEIYTLVQAKLKQNS